MPLPFMLLLILAGLLLLWFSRWQKTGKTLITVSWLGLVLLSLQPVADALLLTTEKPYEKRYELITPQKFSNRNCAISWCSAAALPITRNGHLPPT